ncbi:MAG: hypothetical protein V4539_03880 [Bacteroidota bacterium]
MFKYAILLCLCLLSQLHQQVSGQQLYPVVRSEVLEYGNLKELYLQKKQLADIESALSLVEKFLKEDDLSQISSDPATAKKIKDLLKVIENPEHTLFEIVAINSVTDKKIILTVNTYLYFEKAHLQLYKSSFKIGFDVLQKKLVFPIYHADYTTKKYQHINFHVNKTLADKYRANMLKADNYVSKLIAHVKEKYPSFKVPAAKLNYVISDGYFNSLEYYGIQNYFNIPQYTKNSNTILDLVARGFYKHELIHYIFSEYNLKKFLNEGMATLFSGGKAKFEADPLTEWEAISKGIRSDEKYRAVFDNADSLFDGAYSHELYYTSAVLLYQYYLKLGDRIFFKQLFETLVRLDNKDVLGLIKKELGITKLSTYLESIDDQTWKSLKAGFDPFFKIHSNIN